ncbi:MAG: beta-eliminating lyase-related protein [Acidimicrobiales bacterium]
MAKKSLGVDDSLERGDHLLLDRRGVAEPARRVQRTESVLGAVAAAVVGHQGVDPPPDRCRAVWWGRGARVGCVLAAPAHVFTVAIDARTRLGGAMRQAGVIAAAGLVALEQMVERLDEDHARARRLAEAVAERWPDGGAEPARVTTNVVLFTHADPSTLIAGLAAEGCWPAPSLPVWSG